MRSKRVEKKWQTRDLPVRKEGKSVSGEVWKKTNRGCRCLQRQCSECIVEAVGEWARKIKSKLKLTGVWQQTGMQTTRGGKRKEVGG